MAVNKNFVVRNGLEVAENLIYANDVTREVGVGIITARYNLDVVGSIGGTSIEGYESNVVSISTSKNNYIDGWLSVGATTGTNGQLLKSTGTGLEWFSLPAAKSNQVYTATDGQTTFTVSGGYNVGLLDVFVNGVKLLETTEFTATNASTFILKEGAIVGTKVEAVAYGTVAAGVGTTTTGIDGITIKDDGIQIGPTGTVKTIDFVGASVSTFSPVGLGVTVTVTGGGGGAGLWKELVGNAGIYTDAKSVAIGTITPAYPFEVGQIGEEANNQVKINGGLAVSGIVTITGPSVGAALTITPAADLITSAGVITAKTFSGTLVGNLTGDATGLTGTPDISVAAITASSNLNITGITTLASAAGIVTTGGDLWVGGDLYVKDDITYDQVSGRELYISGVATAAGGFSGDLTGNIVSGIMTGSLIGDLTGNIVSGIMTGNVVGLASTAAEIHVMSDNTGGPMFPLFTSGTGIHTALNDNAFQYAPATNTLTCGVFDGSVSAASLTGTLLNARLPSVISIAGSMTAASFWGDGTGLTDVPGVEFDQNASALSTSKNLYVGTNAASASVGGGDTSFYVAGTSRLVGVATAGIMSATTYFGDVSETVETKWTLSKDGSNTYYSFTGLGFTDVSANRNPTLFLQKGKRYHFFNGIGAQALWIKNHSSKGVTGATGLFTPGVSGNGTEDSTLVFDVPFNAPHKLCYQSGATAGMGGTIYLSGSTRYETQKIVSTGQTTEVLSYEGRSVDDIFVVLNGSVLTPDDDYSVVGLSSLTFVDTPISDSKIVVRYMPL